MCMFMFMHFNYLSMLFVKPDFCQKMLWSICATVDIKKYVYRKTFIKDCLQISLLVLSKFRRINNFLFPLKSLDVSSWAFTSFLNFLTGSFFKGCNYSKRIFKKKKLKYFLFYFLLNWFTYQNICNTPYIEVILKSFTYIINRIIVISYISIFNENYS